MLVQRGVAVFATALLASAALLPHTIRLLELPLMLVLPGTLVLAVLMPTEGLTLRATILAVCISFAVLIGICLLLTAAGVRLSVGSVSLATAGACVAAQLALQLPGKDAGGASAKRPMIDRLRLARSRSVAFDEGLAARVGWALAGLLVIAGSAVAMRAAWPQAVSPPYVAVGMTDQPTIAGAVVRVSLVFKTDRAGIYRLSWPGAPLHGPKTVTLGRHTVHVVLREPRSDMCQSVLLAVDGTEGRPSTTLTFVPGANSSTCPV